MKNGCKDFVSPIMDELGIEPFYDNRVDDIVFAQVKLRILNNRGHCLENSMQLIGELHRYINYLYSHIEQIEKDKQYLLIQRLKE